MEFLRGLLHSLLKTFTHVISGKSELQRITEGYPVARNHMVKRVRTSLRCSKQLKEVRVKVVDSCDDFSVKSMVQLIRAVKKFENPGIVFSIGSLRRTNVGILHLSTLANTPFSEAHDSSLVELWDSLQPGKPREGSNLRHSASWSDIGFQGLDPATDFRGGGLLSLENLRYFGRENGDVARRILNEQCRDVTQGGFPFAITGINITAFLLNVVLKRKLDDLFQFSSAEAEDTAQNIDRSRARTRAQNAYGQTDETSPLLSDSIRDDEDEHQDDEETKTLALERFNVAYSVVFTLFSNRWREAAPRDAMGFSLVFSPFKKDIETMFNSPEGIQTLARL